MTINFERFIRALGYKVRKVRNIRGAVISEIPPPLFSLYKRKRNDMITNYDAKYSALTIAKYVLRKCTLQNKPLTNIKLQKMLFMIQKEYLKYNNLCFYENIEAWQFGPCIPKVYYRYGYCYGVMPIRLERDYCADLLISLDDRLVISTVVDKYINKDNLCWRFPLMEKLYEKEPQRIVYFEDILKENDYDKRTEEKAREINMKSPGVKRKLARKLRNV